MVWNLIGREHPLREIFSKEFDYSIPYYQRPYAWNSEKTITLFEDLIEFYERKTDLVNPKNLGKKSEIQTEEIEDSYFLGSIVLVKREKIPHAMIVDGQQRLITLSIILAAIASLVPESRRDDIFKYIWEPGNQMEMLEHKPRLEIRESDRDFFKKYVQEFNFDELFMLEPSDPELSNKSRRNIQTNSKIIIDKLNSTFKNDSNKLLEFGALIVNYCYLVVVSTPSEQSAFDAFSILNTRGMSLQTADIIKAEVIGSIEQEWQDGYSDSWEAVENQIGRESIDNFLGHIRMILTKKPVSNSIRQDLLKYIRKDITDKKKFINNVLMPYSKLFTTICECKCSENDDSNEINRLFWHLNQINFKDWQPPALLFLRNIEQYSICPVDYFSKLERLSAFFLICGVSRKVRFERYLEIVKSLSDSVQSIDDIKAMELSKKEIDMLKYALGGPMVVNVSSNARKYVILRLESCRSGTVRTYDPSKLSIEHVLPQKIKAKSNWESTWGKKDREYWVHRIANLILLPTEVNASVANLDFKEKKKILFRELKTGVKFELVSEVLESDSWSPSVLKDRQNELCNLLYEEWGLN